MGFVQNLQQIAKKKLNVLRNLPDVKTEVAEKN
jgi:hypothetical protein